MIDRRPMMDVLIEVCAKARLNPATHALIVPSLGGTGTVPFMPSQSLQSLSVDTVRVVSRSQAHPKRPDPQRFNATAPDAQPFEVLSYFCICRGGRGLAVGRRRGRILS